MATLRALCMLAMVAAAAGGNPYCEKAFFWRPDGSREAGSGQWGSTFFAPGPCVGVSGIGTTQTHAKSVIIVDRTDYNNSYMRMPGTQGLAFAQEVRMDQPGFPQRPLDVITNSFCSSGQHVGTRFLNIGGDLATGGGGYIAAKGGFSIRELEPCGDASCDFTIAGSMAANRWYPTSQLLADGRVLVVGGSNTGTAITKPAENVPSVEYFPDPDGLGAVALDFLTATLPYNLYPFVHLLPNGQVFMFAGQQYILYDTQANAAAPGDFPVLKAQDAAGHDIVRQYPLAATSAMLTLSPARAHDPEIIICGGSATPAHNLTAFDGWAPADNMCWRIRPLAPAPKWAGTAMKHPRVMPLCALLPDGSLFIHGGTATGYSGIPNDAHNASLIPEMYLPASGTWYAGNLGVSLVPRAYHSSMIILHDSSVLVSGSNPHQDTKTGVVVSGDDYPTEMRTEIYSPPYFRAKTPPPTLVKAPALVAVGTTFWVAFKAAPGLTAARLSFVLSQPGYSTHNGNHGMRQAELALKRLRSGGNMYAALLAAPPNKNVVPPTWYWLFIVADGVPNREGHHVLIN